MQQGAGRARAQHQVGILPTATKAPQLRGAASARKIRRSSDRAWVHQAGMPMDGTGSVAMQDDTDCRAGRGCSA